MKRWIIALLLASACNDAPMCNPVRDGGSSLPDAEVQPDARPDPQSVAYCLKVSLNFDQRRARCGPFALPPDFPLDCATVTGVQPGADLAGCIKSAEGPCEEPLGPVCSGLF